MADSKYGRIFTASDVEKIFEYADIPGSFASTLKHMDADNVRFKFEPDEPLFILRGRDRRAAGAIMHYRDHQSPNAPSNHTDGIAKAFRAFNLYREENPGLVKEPD